MTVTAQYTQQVPRPAVLADDHDSERKKERKKERQKERKTSKTWEMTVCERGQVRGPGKHELSHPLTSVSVSICRENSILSRWPWQDWVFPYVTNSVIYISRTVSSICEHEFSHQLLSLTHLACAPRQACMHRTAVLGRSVAEPPRATSHQPRPVHMFELKAIQVCAGPKN